jgi:hypothetical protein
MRLQLPETVGRTSSVVMLTSGNILMDDILDSKLDGKYLDLLQVLSEGDIHDIESLLEGEEDLPVFLNLETIDDLEVLLPLVKQAIPHLIDEAKIRGVNLVFLAYEFALASIPMREKDRVYIRDMNKVVTLVSRYVQHRYLYLGPQWVIPAKPLNLF